MTPSEILMGQDELLKACRERPEKVVAAIIEMCDHQEALNIRWINIPLGTQAGVVEAAVLQGEARALQTLLSELFDKLTEEELDDGDPSPTEPRRDSRA